MAKMHKTLPFLKVYAKKATSLPIPADDLGCLDSTSGIKGPFDYFIEGRSLSRHKWRFGI